MIRTAIIAVLLLWPLQALAEIDYHLNVTLHPAEQAISSTATIYLDETIGSLLDLEFSANCELHSIEQAGQSLYYSRSNENLSIRLKNRKPVQIRYRGVFTDQPSSIPIHNEDPTYGISASISGRGTFLSAAAHWYPRLNRDKINYRLEVISPPGIECVSSGKRSEHHSDDTQTVSIWKTDYPIYGLTLSAGNYMVFEDLGGSTPIYAYFYAQTTQLASTYLSEARRYLNLYEELFGPYPFHKFAIVENFFPTGYGFPSWTLLGSRVVRLPFIVKTSLGHEIAHSWWGTGIRVADTSGNWAEGLTTYVADYLYKERSSTDEAYEYRLKILRDFAGLVNKENAFPISRFRSRSDKASQAIGYGKTAMLFHMLRNKVGEQVFWGTLKKIAENRMFEKIGWSDLNEEFSRYSQKNLKIFFEQWLSRKMGPKIVLDNVEVKQVEAGFQVTGVLKQTSSFYRFRTAIVLKTTVDIEHLQLDIDKPIQDFEFTTTGRPLELSVDPESQIFRLLDEKEIPPTTNSVRGSRKLLVIKGNEYLPTAKAMATLLGGFRKQDLKAKPITNITQAELENQDLLIFGNSPVLPTEIMAGNNLLLAGSSHSIEGKSIFIVTANPYSDEHVAAWFLSDNNDNDIAVARKIPHYGKYSYLLFAGDKNKLKGTFPARESPLTVKFDKN